MINMSVKKEYSVGDSVWIYGVGSKNTLTKGFQNTQGLKTFKHWIFCDHYGWYPQEKLGKCG